MAAPLFPVAAMADDRDTVVTEIKSTMDEIVWRSLYLGSLLLRQYDLTLQQALALQGAVRLGPSVAMSTLANATLLSPSTVTSAVDRLVARGLLRRYAHVSDRRKVVVDATESGVAMHLEMEAQDLDYWRWMMRDATDEQLAILRETFGQLLVSLGSLKPGDWQRGTPFPATLHDDPS